MATLEITYWATENNLQKGNIPGKVISSESVTITGTSAQSTATPASTDLVSIVAYGSAARFEYSGTNPTAAAGSAFLSSGERIWLPAVATYKIAGITA